MLCVCTEYEQLLPVKDLDSVRPALDAKLLNSLWCQNMTLKNVYHKGNNSSLNPKGREKKLNF